MRQYLDAVKQVLENVNDKEIIAALLPFARHKSGCDATAPMWNKAPCECGFAELVVKLRAQGIPIIDGAFYEDQPQPPLGEPPAEQGVHLTVTEAHQVYSRLQSFNGHVYGYSNQTADELCAKLKTAFEVKP